MFEEIMSNLNKVINFMLFIFYMGCVYMMIIGSTFIAILCMFIIFVLISLDFYIKNNK